MWLIANDGERALVGKGSTGNCGTSNCTGAMDGVFQSTIKY